MADFPTSLFIARATENLPGIVYDPTKKQNLFSEDFQNLGGEISAIEICLGLSPKWASASVAERIKGIRSLSDANEAVITIKGANVGIGTTAPTEKLHIYDGTNASKPNIFLDSDYQSVNFSDRGGLFFGVNGTPIAKMIMRQSQDGMYGLDFSTYDGFNGGIHNSMVVLGNGNVGIATTSPTAKLDILSDILRLRTAKTPATAGAAGNAGDICWDSSYLYVCVATNSWVRSAHAAW